MSITGVNINCMRLRNVLLIYWEMHYSPSQSQSNLTCRGHLFPYLPIEHDSWALWNHLDDRRSYLLLGIHLDGVPHEGSYQDSNLPSKKQHNTALCISFQWNLGEKVGYYRQFCPSAKAVYMMDKCSTPELHLQLFSEF